MAKGDVKKQVVSKWDRTQVVNVNGLRDRLQQVVYKTEIGTRKGKVKYKSQTKHERI